MALLSNGTVMAWGNNETDQLGDGYSGTAEDNSVVPVPVCARAETPPCRSDLTNVTAVAAGARHNLALLSSGYVESWGDNESGQLGDGFTGLKWNRRTPVPVRELSGVTAVAAGEEHSLALLSDGTVMSWGSNESGQLGDGKYADRNVRIRVRGVSGVIAIAAGEEHSLALLSNHTVVAWGSDEFGQLGNGSTTGPESCVFGACSRTPVPVNGLSEVEAIAAGGNHSLALLKNGTVMAWGENTYGELGDGNTTDSDVPVPVSNLHGVTAVAAAREHSLALLGEGSVMAWGNNAEGQLGVGQSNGPEACGPAELLEACSTSPLLVSGLRYINVKGIAAGAWHSLAFGPPKPTVTGLSPSHGSEVGGTVVTITGTEFTGATAVKFGSSSATLFKVESPTSITAISPKGTGSVDVTVTTPEGTSPTSAADEFAYTPLVGGSATHSTKSSSRHVASQTETAREPAHLAHGYVRRHHKTRRKPGAESVELERAPELARGPRPALSSSEGRR